MCLPTEYPLQDQADFQFIPRNMELLGDQAKDCDLTVSMEKAGLEDRRQYTLSYVLFRCVSEPVHTRVLGMRHVSLVHFCFAGD